MNLTWHIVRKDLRRYWTSSLILAGLVILETLCGVRLLGHDGDFDHALFSRVNGYAGMLVTIQMLTIIVLTAAIIQEDRLVGTSSYWMTRPISNRRLLAAKAASLTLLLGLFPSLAAIPWWIYAGLAWSEMTRGIAFMVAAAGTFALLSAPFALVTPNLARFLLSLFLCLLSFMCAFALMRIGGPNPVGSIHPHLSQSRSIVFGFLIVAVSIAVILIQLRPRMTLVASYVLGAGYLAGIVSSFAWPWILPRFRATDPSATTVTRQITARPVGAELLPEKRGPLLRYRLAVELSNLPQNSYATGTTLVGQRLTWSDSDAEIKVTGPLTAPWLVPQAETLLGLGQAATEASYTTRLFKDLTIQPAVVDRFRKEPASYEMVARFWLHTPRLDGEIPVHEGAKLKREGRLTRIVSDRRENEVRRIAVIASKPSLQRSVQTREQLGLFNSSLAGSPIFYLVERRLGRVLQPETYSGPGRPVNRCVIAHVEIVWRELLFTGDTITKSPDAALNDEDQLTLAVIHTGEVASFERRILFPSSMFATP